MPPLTTDEARVEIERVCDELKTTLLEKNAAYGNSALDPVRIFSKADAEAQILVRLDDKLSRIARGEEGAFGEDVILDLLGYLVLLRVARRAAMGEKMLKLRPKPPPFDDPANFVQAGLA